MTTCLDTKYTHISGLLLKHLISINELKCGCNFLVKVFREVTEASVSPIMEVIVVKYSHFRGDF